MELLKNLMTTLPEGLELGSELDPRDREQAKVDSYNREQGDLNEKDGYDCQECKNKGYIAMLHHNEQFGYYSETLVACKCMKIRKAINRLNRSGLRNIVKDYTFAKYEAEEPWQQAIKSAAQKFLKDEGNNWFFIGGQSGAGKSHICSAIAVQYIRDGKEVKYMLWRDEINKIKAVVNVAVEYADLVEPLKKAEVLYIDDLFKTGKDETGRPKQPTSAEINAAFEIINYRYNNPGLVTIISSERTLSDLNNIDEAIAGRIAEKSLQSGYCINLKKDPSRNWRMKGVGEI